MINNPLDHTGRALFLSEVLVPIFPKKISTFVELTGYPSFIGLNVDAASYVYHGPMAWAIPYFREHAPEQIFSDIQALKEWYAGDLEGLEAHYQKNKDDLAAICAKKEGVQLQDIKDIAWRMGELDATAIRGPFREIDMKSYGKDSFIFVDAMNLRGISGDAFGEGAITWWLRHLDEAYVRWCIRVYGDRGPQARTRIIFNWLVSDGFYVHRLSNKRVTLITNYRVEGSP